MNRRLEAGAETPLRFRRARASEKDAVYALYRQAIGSAGCVWDAEYPTMTEVNHDFETDNLYVLSAGAQVWGALSVVPENEMDDLPHWRHADACEIARVVIGEAHRGQGLAAVMVRQVLDILRARGCRAVHLAVAKENAAAHKTYVSTGFERVGEVEMYGGAYFLMEKALDGAAVNACRDEDWDR